MIRLFLIRILLLFLLSQKTIKFLPKVKFLSYLFLYCLRFIAALALVSTTARA